MKCARYLGLAALRSEVLCGAESVSHCFGPCHAACADSRHGSTLSWKKPPAAACPHMQWPSLLADKC